MIWQKTSTHVREAVEAAYALIGRPPGAKGEQAKKLFKKIAEKHPDKNGLQILDIAKKFYSFKEGE